MATTVIYTLSLHDALPIWWRAEPKLYLFLPLKATGSLISNSTILCHLFRQLARSEEHTSELQSHSDLVCRLLLEKQKNTTACRRCSTWRYHLRYPHRPG